MDSKTQYVFNKINKISLTDRYAVCRILAFRDFPLRQSNNGVYINIKEIDQNTINEIYNLLKYKLND